MLQVLLCNSVNAKNTKRKMDYFAVNKKGLRKINIASLLPADDWRLFSIKRISPAIDIAIEKVNPTFLSSNCTLVGSACPCVRSGFSNGTNGIPTLFKVLPMVPLVIPFVPMVMPMVPLALPVVQLVPLVSQWYHWLPMVPLVKLPMVPSGEPRTEPIFVNNTLKRLCK